ncbi:MAG TPA: TrmH family RNA methyltransferase, partial [Chitinophagales bacterium]|nr:TrmH family RNA methyltransferase [Chitinophagales bacterium]
MLSQQEIKLINALKIKKYRTKYSQFIAEGDKIIKELIDKGMEVVHIYSTHPEEFNVKEIKKVSEADLKKVTALQHPNHSLAVFSIPTATFNIDDKEWIVVLDDIQDPGNMGTIIRTCDWFGVKKIICSEGCVDAYNPKVVQASMASIASVQIQEINLEEILMDSKLPIYGAVLNG